MLIKIQSHPIFVGWLWYNRDEGDNMEYKKIANWVKGPLLGELNERGLHISECPVSSKDFAELVHHVNNNFISENVGKKILGLMIDTGKPAWQIILEQDLMQKSDENELKTIINEVIKENPKVIQEIKNGKKKAIGFLVGQVMQKTEGKANPKIVNEILQLKWSD
jgi:aspartyl-tRNA(Asn)/glutamyl-tRNA(Gln) amidotransferase subunit B